VIGGTVASHRDVGIKEKKDSLSGRPSSFLMVAGARFVVLKKIPGRTVKFTYLADALEVAQRTTNVLAA
jgi:hypothetical protein